MGITSSQNKTVQMKNETILRQINLSGAEQKDQNENQYKNQEYECTIWNRNQHVWCQRKFQISFTLQNQMKYIFNGEVIRIEEIQNSSKEPEVLTTLEQIKYLLWRGNYSNNGKKIGKWSAYWQGEKLQEVGGYYSEDGYKQGQWKEIMRNYCEKFKVFEFGEYQNNQKIGRWNYVYINKNIGGGFYNEEAQKIGKWIEIKEGVKKGKFLTFTCEYKKGKNVGIQDYWNVMDKYIGGGLYSDKDDGVKQGNWREIIDGINYTSKAIYQGKYKNGKKVGRWDILSENAMIGGGDYDVEGKLGEWKEISFWNKSDFQVTYLGKYENGNKIGFWDFELRGFEYDPIQQKQKNVVLDGCNRCGLYQKGIKFGKWIDLDEGFEKCKQVIHTGEYKNGQKFGQWDIQFKRHRNDQYLKIGGGLYADGVKFGKWIELDEGFTKDKQVTHTGEYKNGLKVGRWDIEFKLYNFNSFSTIGGGSYAEGVKFGEWIDLDEKFTKDKQVTHTGEYKNCQKDGYWDIKFKGERYDPFSKIGGGLYVEGVKFGKWIGLDEKFSKENQITHRGEYINGTKIGTWNEMERNEINMIEGFKEFNVRLNQY